MVNTTYVSTQDIIKKLQQVQCKAKLKFFKNISNYYDNMNIRLFQDSSAKNAQGISKIYHEVLMLMKFLQTKPQVKNMNINYHDLYYTVIKNRDEKEIIIGKDNDNDYINFNDINPNHIIYQLNHVVQY